MGDTIKRETREFKRNIKRLAQLFFILLTAYLIFIYFFVHPSHERNWETGFEIMPSISIDNTKVQINNFRDYQYTASTEGELKYKNIEVDINDLERAWFIHEPFVIKPFTSFNGVAHTYFVFDFKNSEPIAVSVEARREKGEKYDAWLGLINKYELFYVWGSETDESVRRVIDQNNELYMFPLTVEKETVQKLFIQLANTTIELEKNPRFYNTLTSNCTSELAKNANIVKEGIIPSNNRALLFPGYADDELYKLGLIPNEVPLDEASKKYYISDKIRELYRDPEFSQKLREQLLP